MSDPIKAALEAGAAAINRDTDSFVLPDDFADGVAAFLRALPDEGTENGCRFWFQVPRDERARLWLAAAAERAAKEDGDA